MKLPTRRTTRQQARAADVCAILAVMLGRRLPPEDTAGPQNHSRPKNIVVAATSVSGGRNDESLFRPHHSLRQLKTGASKVSCLGNIVLFSAGIVTPPSPISETYGRTEADDNDDSFHPGRHAARWSLLASAK